MSEKRRNKGGRNPKLDPAVFRYTVRFSEEEHNRFLSMFEKSGVYAKSVFLKAHFFGQPFKVLKVDKTLVDYYTKLSDFHAQFRAIGTNYNQVVKELRLHFSEKKGKYSINSLVYWVTYVHNVVYSFYRSMIYCYINSTQRCAGSIVIDIIPTNGADKRKFFPFAPYFPVTNVIKRYFYPYFPAIIGIKGYSFPYFPYLSGIMKIKTALYSLFSRLDWHKTVVFPCLGEIYEGIRSLSWEIPVT